MYRVTAFTMILIVLPALLWSWPSITDDSFTSPTTVLAQFRDMSLPPHRQITNQAAISNEPNCITDETHEYIIKYDPNQVGSIRIRSTPDTENQGFNVDQLSISFWTDDLP